MSWRHSWRSLVLGVRLECTDPGPLVPCLEGASSLQSFMACFWQLDFQDGFLDAHYTALFPCGHATTCACSRHVLQPWAAVQVLPLPHTTSKKGDASVNPQLHVVRSLNSCARSRIWVVSTVLQICGDWELRQYPTCGHNVMVTRFGLLVQISTARPSVPASNTMALLHGHGPDHPVLDCTTGISQSLALSAVVSKKDARGCVWCADARTLTVATHGNRNALWKTGTTFSIVWCIPLLPLTPGGVRNVLATFSAGRYRTPEQHVSEVQRGDTILSSQVPDPATELTIREYVPSVQARQWSSLLKILITVPALLGGHVRSRKALPLLWCA